MTTPSLNLCCPNSQGCQCDCHKDKCPDCTPTLLDAAEAMKGFYALTQLACDEYRTNHSL